MNTAPPGVEVIERKHGSEIGTWPTTGPMAKVTYRVTAGTPEAVLEALAKIAAASGWEIDSEGYLKGRLMTEDGPAKLSAFNPSATRDVILTLWL